MFVVHFLCRLYILETELPVKVKVCVVVPNLQMSYGLGSSRVGYQFKGQVAWSVLHKNEKTEYKCQLTSQPGWKEHCFAHINKLLQVILGHLMIPLDYSIRSLLHVTMPTNYGHVCEAYWRICTERCLYPLGAACSRRYR